MADGPVANLPEGMDAYAGYVNKSGIGITWPAVNAIPAKYHLSITTNGSPAMCADVESGAMIHWLGYDYGYCSVSAANALVAKYGRPLKLWTAHYTGFPHICSSTCWPGLNVWVDGTQWTDHAGAYDESLLDDTFFDLASPSQEDDMQIYATTSAGTGFVIAADLSHKVGIPDGADAAALLNTGLYRTAKLSDQMINDIPEAPGTV
jgi:hypothetical protein